jgi:predicted HTH domain antitoxin
MMEVWQAKDFVSAGLYEDERAVVQDAVRALLSEKPQLRLEVAIHRYRTEAISLAKAAALAGVSWERMREILLSRGVQPRLGPETEEEAREEIQAMERIAREDAQIHPFAEEGWIELVSMVDEEELRLFRSLPRRLHRGEASCLTIARHRGWAFLTDENAAERFVPELGAA